MERRILLNALPVLQLPRATTTFTAVLTDTLRALAAFSILALGAISSGG